MLDHPLDEKSRRKVCKSLIPRGIRNNNPFNIKRTYNSWKGKLKNGTDKDFEQFRTIDYGLRAGFLLLRNAYIAKGFNTVEKIIPRFAPATENNVSRYCDYIVANSPLDYDTKISVNSLSFYWLCQRICLYESRFDLSYDKYIDVIKKFNLW